VLGDLASAPEDRLIEALDGAFALVHVAARVHKPHETSADAFHAGNVVATQRVAAAAVRAGVQRIVFTSTIKVHGETTASGRPFRSDDPFAAQDAYARSKADAERALVSVCSGTDTTPIVLRLPLVYGPRVTGNFLALLDAVARRAPLPFSAIHNRRDLLYVGNLGHAITRLLDCPEPPTGAWLVADGEALSTPDLARRIATALGVAPRIFPVPLPLFKLAALLTGRASMVQRLAASLEVDASPLAQKIGAPPFGVTQGLAATAQWWRARHSI
jgi:nucleoside-diphosphate-sugar epimerase